jgi:hypothetical protein
VNGEFGKLIPLTSSSKVPISVVPCFVNCVAEIVTGPPARWPVPLTDNTPESASPETETDTLPVPNESTVIAPVTRVPVCISTNVMSGSPFDVGPELRYPQNRKSPPPLQSTTRKVPLHEPVKSAEPSCGGSGSTVNVAVPIRSRRFVVPVSSVRPGPVATTTLGVACGISVRAMAVSATLQTIEPIGWPSAVLTACG